MLGRHGGPSIFVPHPIPSHIVAHRIAEPVESCFIGSSAATPVAVVNTSLPCAHSGAAASSRACRHPGSDDSGSTAFDWG